MQFFGSKKYITSECKATRAYFVPKGTMTQQKHHVVQKHNGSRPSELKHSANKEPDNVLGASP